MEYVLPALLVLILVGGFVTFMVLNATKKSGPVADSESEGAPGIGSDDTPLGDTDQHAGTHSSEGTTVHDPEAALSRTDDPDAAAHVARPGEGEGHRALEFDGTQPAPATTGGRTSDASEARERETAAAADAAPDEPGGDAASKEDSEPEPPASERLADRGV